MSLKKYERELVEDAYAAGSVYAELEHTKKHIKLHCTAPSCDVTKFFTNSSTPSDWRAMKNNKARIKRWINSLA